MSLEKSTWCLPADEVFELANDEHHGKCVYVISSLVMDVGLGGVGGVISCTNIR